MAYGALADILSSFNLSRLWRYAKEYKLLSQSDYFATRLNSPGLGILVAVVGVIAIIPYLQLQITGLGLIMEVTSYGAVGKVLAKTIGVVVVALYVKNTNLALLAAVQNVFPAWFVGVVGGAGILTTLVPGSLLMMTGATLIAENIYRPLVKATSDKQVQTIARIMVWVIAGVALYFSINGNATIVALLLMGYNFVTQFFPAVILSLFTKHGVNKYGAMGGILVGVAIVVYFTMTKVSILWGINTGFLALLINFIVVWVVSALTPNSPVSSEQPAHF